MKIICKKCEKRCKFHDIKNITCDNVRCDLKYDMHDEELSFDNYVYPSEEPNCIMDITSPEPTITVHKDGQAIEINEKEWLAMVESGQFSDTPF